MQELSSTTKIQLSLSSIMFFSPFIKNIIHNKAFVLSADDNEFIAWYITLWYINITLLALSILSAIGMYALDLPFLNILYYVLLIILLLLLVWESVAILLEKPLLHSKHGFWYTSIALNKTQILLSYLPLYNIYLRYHIHDFQHIYRWPKESIFLWIIFIFTSLVFQTPVISTVIFILIIARVASLFGWIDVLPDRAKNKLNTLFTKNPEELWWYVTWTIRSIFHKETVTDAIKQQQLQYSLLLPLTTPSLIINYCLWLVIFLGAIYLWIQLSSPVLYYIALGLILWRYLLMYIKWRHVPYLPVCKEIIDSFVGIYTLLKKSFLSRK